MNLPVEPRGAVRGERVPLGGDAPPARGAPLAALDDRLGRGAISPVKKWWWDIEADPKTMQYVRARQVHARASTSSSTSSTNQTLAVYPAT
jgi:hypothetical protein